MSTIGLTGETIVTSPNSKNMRFESTIVLVLVLMIPVRARASTPGHDVAVMQSEIAY
jgi:hypothetical protein